MATQAAPTEAAVMRADGGAEPPAHQYARFGSVAVAVLSSGLAVLLLPRGLSVMFGNERKPEAPPPRLLSSHELSSYSGEAGSDGLYLAILGQVFDVRKGFRHYGPGGAYHGMAGKDASSAFVTGDFSERGLTPDVSGLSPLQVAALFDWLAFYQREYHAVGVLVGHFYTEAGLPTEELLRAEASLAEGKRIRDRSAQLPACNSEWSGGRGRVWCSTRSGGVQRDWTGFPRQLFSPDSPEPRCVCVQDASLAEDNPNLRRFDGCAARAESCSVRDGH